MALRRGLSKNQLIPSPSTISTSFTGALPMIRAGGSRRPDGRYTGKGFYSPGDIREITAGARKVEVIPAVDLSGHTSAVPAACPGPGCTGGPCQVEDPLGVLQCRGLSSLAALGGFCMSLEILSPVKVISPAAG
jgi:hypothetical protein